MTTLTAFTDALTLVDGRGRSNALLRVIDKAHKVVIKNCKAMGKEVEAEGGLESTYVDRIARHDQKLLKLVSERLEELKEMDTLDYSLDGNTNASTTNF